MADMAAASYKNQEVKKYKDMKEHREDPDIWRVANSGV